MAKSASQDTQPYDSLMKHLFRNEAGEIIPLLLPGAKLVSELNIEIDRSTLKVDLALKILYKQVLAILNLESQSSEDEEMEQRMTIYNAALHYTYGLPVISILLYLFKCATAVSPYHVKCADRMCLSSYYDVIRLWELDPQPYVDQHQVSLYVLLPGMMDPSVTLLKRAIKEIYDYYDEKRAYELLSQFSTMLKRTTTVSAADKQKIQEELEMLSPYQQFLSHNPDVERIAQEKKIEGEIKGKIEGKVDSILTILKFRFSDDALLSLAKQALGSVHDIQVLGKLEYEALRASNKQDVHKWLESYLPQNKAEDIVERDRDNEAE